MSDLLLDDDLQSETVNAAEPAKGWRNWWRCDDDRGFTLDAISGQSFATKRGDVVSGDTIFPSKDIAVSRALEFVAKNPAALTFIDALPEGERP
jgi:hypothetical protein